MGQKRDHYGVFGASFVWVQRDHTCDSLVRRHLFSNRRRVRKDDSFAVLGSRLFVVLLRKVREGVGRERRLATDKTVVVVQLRDLNVDTFDRATGDPEVGVNRALSDEVSLLLSDAFDDW